MSTPRPTRRILVLLDASPASQAAAEAGAEVAASLGAELLGLFVEDAELLALATHPLVREVDLFAQAVRPVDPRALERRLRARAGRARAGLERAAPLQRVAWSFEVVRGEVGAEVERAAEGADLVALGRVGWSEGPRRMGRTARRLVAGSPRGLLLHGRRAPPGAPVVVCDAGSAAAPAALDAAAALARRSGRPLRVLVFAPEGEEGDVRVREAEERLAREPGLPYRIVRRPREPAPPLAELPEARGCALLVLPADGPVARDELPATLEALEAPVLLVR